MWKRRVEKKSKGIKTKEFPKHWGNYQRINDDDTEEQKNKKEFFNSILVEKKPYFFKYLYRDSKSAYSKFLKEEETYRAIHEIDLESLLQKEKNGGDFSEKELYYLQSMRYRNPLIDSDCEMNKICHYLEGVNFDIKKFNTDNINIYPKYLNESIVKDNDMYNLVKRGVKTFIRCIKDDISMGEYSQTPRYSENESLKTFDKFELFKEKMNDCCSNVYELTNYLIEIFYTELKSANKDLLWKCYGKYIFNNILEKSNKVVNIPHINAHGFCEYLFDRYDVVEVNIFGE